MVRFLLSVVVVAAVFVAGCAKSSVPAKAQVHGTVKVDNEPLKEGEIAFIAVGKSETLVIKDGAFDGKVEPGDWQVQIMAYKEVPSVPMEGVVVGPSKENYLPARYNSASTLKAPVKAGGPNEFKFDDLKSK